MGYPASVERKENKREREREESAKRENIQNDGRGTHTYRESLRRHLFAFPAARLSGHLEEFHVAMGQMRSVVCIKYEDAPVWRERTLARREQRPMLLFYFCFSIYP